MNDRELPSQTPNTVSLEVVMARRRGRGRRKDGLLLCKFLKGIMVEGCTKFAFVVFVALCCVEYIRHHTFMHRELYDAVYFCYHAIVRYPGMLHPPLVQEFHMN